MNVFRLSLALTLCALAFLSATPAFALDIPRPRKEKEKKAEKKDEAKSEKSEESTGAASAESTPKESKKEESKEPAGRQVVEAPQTEATLTKEMWEHYKNYKAGDFVVYEYPANPGLKQKQEVVEVGANFVVVNMIQTMPQMETRSKIKYVFKDEIKTAEEKLTIAAKEVQTTRTEVYSDGKLTSRSWTSKDVPLGGMVKSEAEGAVQMQLVDFGRGK